MARSASSIACSCSSWQGRGIVLALLCLLGSAHAAGATSTTSAQTAAQAPGMRSLLAIRATCPAISCASHPQSRTPYRITGVQYDSASRLCFTVAGNGNCASCTSSCRATKGIQNVFVANTDLSVRPSLKSATATGKLPSGTAQASAPGCVRNIGVATTVRRNSGKALVVGRNVKTSLRVCLQYPTNTPFRRVGTQTDNLVTKPAALKCCTSGLAFKPPTSTIQMTSAGVQSAGAYSCLACARFTAKVATATIQGTVYQDNNNNNVYTPGIDQGFEGATVNLYRSAGGKLAFLGCTSTDGTGFYRFAKVVVDQYVVEVQKPAVSAGAKYSFKFAVQNAGKTSAYNSQVSATTGRTGAFLPPAGATTVRNAVLQIKF